MESPAPTSDLEEMLLAHVRGPDYRPAKPRVIARELGLDEDRHRDLKKVIKRLVKRGELSYGADHRVQSGGEQKQDRSLVIGTFRRAAAGFGFVRPKETLRSAGQSADIFIPLRKTLDAANGDVVKVRVKERLRNGELRQSGAIIEVLERETHQFVGVYIERAGTALVQVDGALFAQPIPVGDPGAKGAVEQDKVVIELVKFPSHWHPGEGVIVEVLGARGAPGVDTLSIMREFQLPDRFSEEVLESARAQAARFDESLGTRLDLTGEAVITIDPVDARDFDDAISLVKLENGHWRLGVHIADVAHFVPEKTALDSEARERATSVYLPDRVIPMLPEIISNNLASLQPDRVRYTKTVFIEMTADGAPVATETANSAIKSKRRFTYEEVDEYLADPAAWTGKLASEVHSLLGRMHELGMLLRRRRLERGAIELTLPEIKLEFDTQGAVKGAKLTQNTASHQIIEEFMLAANEAVAQLLSDLGILFLRRIHEPPNPRKLKALTEFVRELGIECESLESRFEIKRVVAAVAGQPEEHAVNFAVLRSMQKAVYGPQTEGHYALHSANYCHFTSPIRRYPDLTVHRILDQLAMGKRPPQDLGRLAAEGDHCSQREQRAEAAERELVKLKLLTYLSRRIGQTMEAVVTGVEAFGLFAQGVKLPAEGLIHINSLQDDYYHYDATTHSLTGNKEGNTFRLGDLIQVEIAHVDVDRRELDFRLIKKLKRTARPRPKQTRKAKAGKRVPAKKKKPTKRRRRS